MPTTEELGKLGIEKEPICPYSPKQNGFAEAINRLLISKVRRTVKPFGEHTYLPLLESIFQHAAYTLNHLKPRNREDLPQNLYHNIKVDEKRYMMFGVNVLVKINNHQEAKTAGVLYNKFNTTVQGSFIGHHGRAGYKVLVNFDKVLTTKDVSNPGGMDKIFQFFENAERLNLERIHPEKDMIGSSNRQNTSRDTCKTTKRYNHLLQQESFDEAMIDALEEEPLEDAVRDSYLRGHSTFPGQPKILTETEEPDEIPQQYSTIILPAENQSKRTDAYRRTTGSELESEYEAERTGIAEVDLMGLETSRANPNSDISGGVDYSNLPSLQNEPEMATDDEQGRRPRCTSRKVIFVTHQKVPTTLGSNEQDDGYDQDGSTTTVDRMLHEDSSRSENNYPASIGTIEGKPLHRTAGNDVGGVLHEEPSTEYPNVMRVSTRAENTSSTPEPAK